MAVEEIPVDRGTIEVDRVRDRGALWVQAETIPEEMTLRINRVIPEEITISVPFAAAR